MYRSALASASKSMNFLTSACSPRIFPRSCILLRVPTTMLVIGLWCHLIYVRHLTELWIILFHKAIRSIFVQHLHHHRFLPHSLLIIYNLVLRLFEDAILGLVGCDAKKFVGPRSLRRRWTCNDWDAAARAAVRRDSHRSRSFLVSRYSSRSQLRTLKFLVLFLLKFVGNLQFGPFVDFFQITRNFLFLAKKLFGYDLSFAVASLRLIVLHK